MTRRFIVWVLIILLWQATAVLPARAQSEPTVQAVMFWMEGCGHCDWVKANVLPPLSAQYGDQWQLELIELRSAEDFDHLFAMGAAIGVPREAIGVPLLIIGDAVLIGSQQIPAMLPQLIEQYLAAGGVGLPDVPGLERFLPELNAAASPAEAANVLPPFAPPPERAPAVASAPVAESAPALQPARNGFTLAIVILVGMVAALGYTAVRLWQIRRGKPLARPPAWLQAAFPLLAVVGLGVAVYLAYVETQAVTAVCGPIGDCNAVQTSEYAYLLGIPIGVLGVVGYLVILVVWAWYKYRADSPAATLLLAITAFGVLFSIYLTYLEPFVIGAVCAWCLTSAVVMTLLLLASVETAVPQVQLSAARSRRD